MTGGDVATRRRDAEARVKEAVARLLGVLREYEGARALRPVGKSPPVAETVLRWCLLVEAVADAFDAAGAGRAGFTADARGLGLRARFQWARMTHRWPADPRWAAASDPGGLSPPGDALRTRLGAAAARWFSVLATAESSRFRAQVIHVACGALDAAEWSELFLVFAGDAERTLLEASITRP
jgi:hypothetical protein